MATPPKPETPKPRDIDPSILTADERAAVELAAEEEVVKAAKDEAKKQLKEKLVKEYKRKTGIIEPLMEVYVDLPQYCDRVTLDNKHFMQGQTYTVPQSVGAVIMEVMQKTWSHQSIVDGKSENFYRKARGTHVLPSGGVINGTSNILRA